MSDVDAALAYVADPDGHTGHIWNEGDAARVLAAEVRRLRAAVEAVKALPSYRRPDTDGLWMDADDVLAALEGE